MVHVTELGTNDSQNIKMSAQLPWGRLQTELDQGPVISVREAEKAYHTRKRECTHIMEILMLPQLHKALWFGGLDHRTRISSKILTLRVYYKDNTQNIVNSLCLPYGLKSKTLCSLIKYGLLGRVWTILSDSATNHLVRPLQVIQSKLSSNI
jgi:hypothetical protein